jgi:phospholipase/lecithinase/hemolysin
VKSFIRFTWCILLFGLIVFPTRASFSSLYIFGDSVSTTTTNPVAGFEPYYGLRRSNGRVWVELLAQQLNLTNNFWYSNNIANHLSYTNLSASSTNWSYSSNNLSYYGQYSTNLLANLNAFAAPTNASNALFIVWVNDADFVGDMGNIYYPSGTNITLWTNAINQSLTNHWRAITNLYYAKGVRTLIMPNAVDITEIPDYNTISSSADKRFIRQRVIDFNAAFSSLLNNAMASCSGLKIYEPDFFSLLDNILTNAAAYGLTNALYNGQSIDVTTAYQNGYTSLPNDNVNGPGTNYIFWDSDDPTAKVHGVLADMVHQMIAPVQISQIASQNGTNQLNLTNVPVGLNGVVLGSTNLALTNWTTVTNFNSTNTVQPVFVPVSGPMQFYRLKFPFTWTWP